MRISARNQIKGTVTEVKKGATTSHVLVDIGGGLRPRRRAGELAKENEHPKACPAQRRYRTRKSLRRTFPWKDPTPRYLSHRTQRASGRVATLSLAPGAGDSPLNRHLVNARLGLWLSLPEWQRLRCRSTHLERTHRPSATFAPLFAGRCGPRTKGLAHRNNRPQRYM